MLSVTIPLNKRTKQAQRGKTTSVELLVGLFGVIVIVVGIYFFECRVLVDATMVRLIDVGSTGFDALCKQVDLVNQCDVIQFKRVFSGPLPLKESVARQCHFV